MTTIAPKNLTIQNQLKTYESRNHIIEALFVLRPYLNVATMNFLSYFKNTDGVTQASILKICKKIGISKTTFYNTVLPELNTFFDEPIMITVKAPPKLDRSRSKRVRASMFKILIPLNKIKYLIEKKIETDKQKLSAFRESLFAIPGNKAGYESDAEKPRQDSSETTFSARKNNTVRELHKDLKTNLIKAPGKIIAAKKYKIKTGVKNFLNTFPIFQDFKTWSEAKRYQVANVLQCAIINTGADIETPKTSHMIKGAISRFAEKYLNKPQDEFNRLLYTFVSNAIQDAQEDHSESSEDHSEDYSEYRSPIVDKILEQKRRQEKKPSQEEIIRERQEMNDLGAW